MASCRITGLPTFQGRGCLQCTRGRCLDGAFHLVCLWQCQLSVRPINLARGRVDHRSSVRHYGTLSRCGSFGDEGGGEGEKLSFLGLDRYGMHVRSSTTTTSFLISPSSVRWCGRQLSDGGLPSGIRYQPTSLSGVWRT